MVDRLKVIAAKEKKKKQTADEKQVEKERKAAEKQVEKERKAAEKQAEKDRKAAEKARKGKLLIRIPASTFIYLFILQTELLLHITGQRPDPQDENNSDDKVTDDPINIDEGRHIDEQIYGNGGEGIEDDEADENAPFSLHPDDPDNFLKLGCALKILTHRWIWENEIEESDRLLREYCTELLTASVYFY